MQLIRVTVSAAFFFLLSGFLNASDREIIVGYVSGASFFPLVTVANGTLASKVEPALLKGSVINAFDNTREHYEIIGASFTALDEISGDRYLYGQLDRSVKSADAAFYSLASHVLPSDAPTESISKDFYRFFSDDNWGKHFFTDRRVLQMDAKEIAGATKVVVHYVTDINQNKQRELWVTATLMYGELAHMVYEQTPQKPYWNLVSYQCIGCD